MFISKSKIILTSILIVAIALLAYHFSPRPSLQQYIPYSTAYTDKQGKLLRMTLAKDERYRLWTPINEVTDDMQQAIILYEDQHFYDNIGVDFIALIRAFWSTYISQERRIGASTITMQVARLHWDIPSRTLMGKIQQILRALQLNKHYSKAKILELYLNLAPFGRNIEGIGAASLIYFNKQTQQLNLIESLSLAVIPQNPNRRNPTSKKGKKQLVKARNTLFKRWLLKHPQHQAYEKFLNLTLNIRAPEQLPFTAPHFINSIQQHKSAWQTGFIKTTLNSPLQHSVETRLKRYINKKRPLGINNAAALVLNYKTMSIEAMVGSADFFNTQIQGQVNGTTAKRSPGSTLKPFVYALALDEGIIHPRSLLKDAPIRYAGFTPENYDQQFLGPVSARDALIKSRNVPAIYLQAQLKNNNFYQFLLNANIRQLKSEAHYGLSLTLGGAEITMLELASLYAMLANQGIYKPIKRYQVQQRLVQNKALLSAEASFLILDILKDNPAPAPFDNSTKTNLDNDIAWKTGTSWAFRDAWAVGISGDYVMLVWVGNFDGKGNNNFIGQSAAGPLLFDIANTIVPKHGWRVSQTTHLQQLNIKQVAVCEKTGDLFNTLCPSAINTWFIPGVSPIKTSRIYRQIPINKHTELRACYHQQGITELKTYEFWPSDFIHIFQQAGINLKTPPALEQECSLDNTSQQGKKPNITSPQSQLDYAINLNQETSSFIPFKATVDSNVTRIHWFINQQYETTQTANKTYLWPAKTGRFTLTAVDDLGRVDTVHFNVEQVH